MVIWANVNTSTSQHHNTLLTTSTYQHHNTLLTTSTYQHNNIISTSHHHNTLLLLLREQQVEQYSEEEHNSDAVLCEHRAHNLGEYRLYSFCPWIAHTNLLAKYHRATVQEERQVTYTPKFGSEAFHL